MNMTKLFDEKWTIDLLKRLSRNTESIRLYNGKVMDLIAKELSAA